MAGCTYCGGELDTHSTTEVICTSCGRVNDGTQMVNELSFGESSSGAAMVHGSFLNADQGSTTRGLYGHTNNSRALTIEKARNQMQGVAHNLRIPESTVSQAVAHYKRALQKGFVKGRKSRFVTCACLYLACRMHKTSHMLLNFSSLLHVNIYVLGSTYLQLVRALDVHKIPPIDPTLFIQRYVSKIEFPTEADGRKVMKDAIRLVQRMNKDWITEGRRPAGVAAASVLLACRMNNFRRSKLQIMQLGMISEGTINDRLREFKNTDSATLTIRDFQATNVDSAADPPSFTRNKERQRQNELQSSLPRPDPLEDPSVRDIYNYVMEATEVEAQEAEEEAVFGTFEENDEELEIQDIVDSTGNGDVAKKEESSPEEAPEALDKNSSLTKDKEQELNSQLSKSDSEHGSESENGNEDDSENENENEDDSENEKDSEIKDANDIKEGLAAKLNTEKDNKQEIKDDQLIESSMEKDEMSVIKEKQSSEEVATNTEKETLSNLKKTPSDSENITKDDSTTAQNISDSLVAKSKDEINKSVQKVLSETLEQRQARIQAILKRHNHPIVTLKSSAHKWDPTASGISDDPENLSDVDDEEINSAILTPAQVKSKEQVWLSLYKDYEIEQAHKRNKRDADIRAGTYKEPRKKRKTGPRNSVKDDEELTNVIPGRSANAAAAGMVKKKLFSKKINYTAISNLF